ncbi:hypothetical protein BOX15_Mlig009369g1, partial [Macrostomum lignano]
SDAKDYITKREIPQLFECLMTGLMYHRPGDHVAYLQDCLEKIKAKGVSSVRWDLFLEAKRAKTPLPPVTPPRGSRPTSSRASSRADSLFDKKPVLPPIGAAAGARVPELARPLNCPVLLVIAGPGSGKARVARLVADRYDCQLISAGALLRAGNDERAREMAPDLEVLAAVIGAINEATADDSCRGLVIEGYPRSLAQLEDYMEHIQRVDHALLLDFEESSLQQRLLSEDKHQPGDIARRISEFKTACLPACRVLDEDGKLLVLPVDPDASDEAVSQEAVRVLDALLASESTRAEPTETSSAKTGGPAAAAGQVTSIRRLVNLGQPADRVADGQSSKPPPMVLLLGGPGSGRRTCLERLGRLNDNKLTIVDLASDLEPDEAVDRLEAAAGDGKPMIVKGFPATEEGLRAMYARVGAPDLALLIDCHEADMMERLAEAGSQSADTAAERMRRFKEETLPVVQHFDEAGLLCVVLGDKKPDDVLKEVKSLVDFVLFNRTDVSLAQQHQAVAEPAVDRLRARPADDESEEAAAAAKIQAGFRGYQVRKQQVVASAAKRQ